MTAPGGADRHRHCATIDTEGDGSTGPGPDGHTHEIEGLEVMASSGHTHGMSAQRCPADHDREGRCLR